jgi:NADH-quinone oxidoreductase subunit G
MVARSFVVIVPPKANSIKVSSLFNLKRPDELEGEVNVLVNVELDRDFPGVELKGDFTVLFSPYYTHDVALADLVIPIETGLEKRGTVEGVEGKLTLNTALKPEYSLSEILDQLPCRETKIGGKESKISKELRDSVLNKGDDELYLTVLPSRTGWNSVSYYSENVAKVTTGRVLLLNPEDAKGSDMVTLKTAGGELTVPVNATREIPQGRALLKVERFTRDISQLLKGYFPAMTGVPCKLLLEV